MADMEMAETYDREAEAVGWIGPEIVLGLAYRYLSPGQTILDIGIGTGLGSALFRKAGLTVWGMDRSEEMLEKCREKGFAASLVRHDILDFPYPYGDGAVDHVVSVGVFQFFRDLGSVFHEAARIVRPGGLFMFITGNRSADEESPLIAAPEQTGLDVPVTMYRHSPEQIGGWLGDSGFGAVTGLDFTVFMDRERRGVFPVRAWLTRKLPDQPAM